MSAQSRLNGLVGSLCFDLGVTQLALRSASKNRYVCFDWGPATQPSEPKKKCAVELFWAPHGCQLQKNTALRRLRAPTFAKGWEQPLDALLVRVGYRP